MYCRTQEMPRASAPTSSIRLTNRRPPWLKSAGCIFAVLCAALAGVVPFIAIACVALWNNSGTSIPHNLLDFAHLHSLTASAARTAGTTDPQLLVDLERLRAVETATAVRIDRLEKALNQVANIAPGPLVTADQETLRHQDIGNDVVSTLGFDWAAWPAGARVEATLTSQGLGRGMLGRMVRAVSTLLPNYFAQCNNVSYPAEVVLAADSVPPSKCFTFRGDDGSIAIRFVRAIQPAHVVVEQMPIWATPHIHAAPRHFEVLAWGMETDSSSQALSVSLGKFEFMLQGPRAQVFRVNSPMEAVRVLQFKFGANWGEDYTSICRLRVMASFDQL